MRCAALYSLLSDSGSLGARFSFFVDLPRFCTNKKCLLKNPKKNDHLGVRKARKIVWPSLSRISGRPYVPQGLP